MFGLATYFAPNASKSDIYTDFAARTPRRAERKLIVARLALGSRLGSDNWQKARGSTLLDCPEPPEPKGP